MIEIRFKPIVEWPRKPTSSRQRSQFSAKYSDTLETLDRELRLLRARNVVIQTHMPESDIRQDGLPKAAARAPDDPGVIVSFDRYVRCDLEARRNIYEPLSFPCDQFTRWQDNLRAIALALEALRKVDRYGVTRIGEQYKGWKALPAPPVEPMTGEDVQRGGLRATQA